jgi:hypothetical protein
MKPVTTNPNVLAEVVTGFGGTVIEAPTFQFTLPLEKVPEAVQRINSLGVHVRRAAGLNEWRENHPTRISETRSVVRLELYREPEPKQELREAWWSK